MWFKEFDQDVVLIPDFEAYRPGVTAPDSTFGVDHEIVPGGWIIDETYFYYELESYDTNFGIKDYVGQTNFPELHFNIVVTRKFLNAFTIHLVPCLIVALLLFSVLMITTADREKAEVFGFSTSDAIGTCSVLFFVILLAHIQLREQFSGSSIVYLEYFYIVTYITILAVALNTYMLPIDSIKKRREAFHRNDNMIPKLLFWPVYLGVLAIITAIYFV
jgi:hypothetical protein